MFATLDTIRLDVLSTTGLNITDGWDYAEHAVIEGKPLLQHVGDKLRQVSLQLRFHRSFCNPEAELNALRGLAAEHRAAMLLMGTGRVIGRFVVTDLREDPDWMLADGRVMAIRCSISLKEHAGEEVTAPPARAVSGSPTARRADEPARQAGGDPAAVPSSQVVRA